MGSVEYGDNQTLWIFTRDELGNVGEYKEIFSKRDSTPSLLVLSPQYLQTWSSPPPITYSVQCDFLDSVWYQIEGYSGIYILIQNTTLDSSIWNQLEDGKTHTLTIYCNSTYGQVVSEEIVFFKAEEFDKLLDFSSPISFYFIGVIGVSSVVCLIVFIKNKGRMMNDQESSVE